MVNRGMDILAAEAEGVDATGIAQVDVAGVLVIPEEERAARVDVTETVIAADGHGWNPPVEELAVIVGSGNLQYIYAVVAKCEIGCLSTNPLASISGVCIE